jgi:uncharacterized protein involved in exopolysaccharide biosynthesis
MRAGEEVSFLAVAAIFLRHRRLIALGALAGALAGLAIAVARPTRYVSTASFVPTTTATAAPASLSALSGAFGISLGSRDVVGTPEFYVEVRIARAVEWLRDDAFKVGIRRGIVQVAVSTSSPELSRQIAERTVRYLAEFNVGKRQSRAVAERTFIENRLNVARAELEDTERQMQAFLQGNRRYEDSPELLFRQQRIQRDLTMRQQVYTSLMQQYEQARVDEVRNTPVVTVIDEANLPAMPEPRRVPFALIAGFLVGAVGATLAAFMSEQARRKRDAQAADYQRFDTVWQDAKAGALRGASPTKLKKLS